VKLGLPIGLTIFLEFSMFSVITLLIGRLGVDAVAAHQIATSVGGMAFMIPMALGMAVAIRVGFNAGRRRSGRGAAQRLGGHRRGAGVCGGRRALPAAGSARHRRAVQQRSRRSSRVAMELMIFVAVYQFVDDTQVTAIGALRGFKDTRTPMIIALVAYWAVGLPVGVVLGFGWLEVPGFEGVRGFWVGLSPA
jgi:multidrug resistance protein, MATE family